MVGVQNTWVASADMRHTVVLLVLVLEPVVDGTEAGGTEAGGWGSTDVGTEGSEVVPFAVVEVQHSSEKLELDVVVVLAGQ